MTSLNPRTSPEWKHRSNEPSAAVSRHNFRRVLISRWLVAIGERPGTTGELL